MMKNGKRGNVSEIMMGSPVTLKPEDTLDLANDVISLGRIRHIPVVDNGRLVGLLSERDLMGAACRREDPCALVLLASCIGSLESCEEPEGRAQ
jgi:predicted transcriptional regulator